MTTDRRVNSGEPTDVAPSFAFGKARVPGHGRGDKIAAMLEPGEAVLTRKAAERVGRPHIAALNRGSQDGGSHGADRTSSPDGSGASRPPATPRSRGLSGLEIAMHAHADREHPVAASP